MRQGDKYVKQNHLLQAVVMYQKVFKEDNSNAQACHNLGMSLSFECIHNFNIIFSAKIQMYDYST